jgi:DNA-binding NarL/FixJ family response regulator
VERVRVVLVEDNQMFRQTLVQLLALDSGIEVVAAVATGREAIEVCRSLRPDVAVIDYRMPGLNGAQATAGVVAAAPGTRVVCLTASISRGELHEILEAGAVRCVMKDEGLDGIVGAIYAAAAPAAA